MTIALNGGTLPASERALRGAGLPVHEQEFAQISWTLPAAAQAAAGVTCGNVS